MARKNAPRVRLDRRMLGGASAAAILATTLAVGDAQAVSFNRGELSGSFDTTLTVGALFRVQDQDKDLIGLTNGGTFYSFNGDDGNLNYDKGLVSLAGRATHELKLNYANLGAFVRATYFYDVVNAKKDSSDWARTGRRPLPGTTIDRTGKDFQLLDALVFGNFDLGGRPLDIRLGNQVLSWGESTFIPNGINTINPINVSALRIPGSELKEAFLPVPIANVSLGITDDFTLEGFYQFKWKETEPEAYGSFFSTTDAGSPGGRGLLLSFGNPNIDIPGFTDSLDVAQVTPLNPLGARILRDRDDEARDQGQYGFAARLFLPNLNDTEVAGYFINYHSRLPLTQIEVATAAEFQAGLGAAATAATLGGRLTAGDPTAPAALAAFFNSQTSPTFRAVNDGTRFSLTYPEDIKLFGASVNTSLPGGISLGAEYSFRKDQPLALDDTEVAQTVASAILGTQLVNALTVGQAQPQIRAALQPLVTAGVLTAAQADAQAASQAAAAGLNAARNNVNLYDEYALVRRLGITQADPLGSTARLLGTTVKGYEDFNVSQFQFTATKAFGPMVGANQWVFVGEAGFTWVHDMPEDYKLDGPGTDLTYIPTIAGQGGAPAGLISEKGFGTEFSWGYRVALRFDYLNAFSGVNLFPSISWQHDVQGTTPSPLGNFVEDRKALSFGLRGVIYDNWTADLSYSTFFGAGKRNLIADRDFVSASIKYSF
ncbi:DUF1302 domain-containing protein [Aerophototrophica crusticola]|uniref:DUF1302 domain-containing protein n=1 Tax=Aerophototrophica crusticola TaxID=1709002 RepID=A0A858R329_9PROT|nr:DUF1302 domain-containing protein [Rhodospirillaceae bacterium B3]